MRFIKSILTLLAATTALSYSAEEKLNKRLDFDLNSLGGVASCLAALDKFKECKIDAAGLQTNKDAVCSSFNSDKCQTIIKGGINSIPECKDLPTEVLATAPIIFEMLSSSIGLACSKDEKGEYCPLSNIIISNDGKLDRNDEAVKHAVEETCKSKKCIDAAVDTLTRIETMEMLYSLASNVKYKKEDTQTQGETQPQAQPQNTQTQNETTDKSFSDYKVVLEYFKSDNCTRINTVTATESSDAYTAFSIYTGFLVTFAIVLPNFF